VSFLDSKKAQGSIEYLFLIGAAILVVSIVIVAMTGLVSVPQPDESCGGTGSVGKLIAYKDKNMTYCGDVNVCIFSYSDWEPVVCPVSGEQTRTYTSSPSDCVGTPEPLTRACTTPNTASCQVFLSPSSGYAPLLYTATVRYANFSSPPASVTGGSLAGVSCAGGANGDCNRTSQIAGSFSGSITASIDGVTCAPATLTKLGDSTCSVLLSPASGPAPLNTTVTLRYHNFNTHPLTSLIASSCGAGSFTCPGSGVSGDCNGSCSFSTNGANEVDVNLGSIHGIVSCTQATATVTDSQPFCRVNVFDNNGYVPFDNIVHVYYDFFNLPTGSGTPTPIMDITDPTGSFGRTNSFISMNGSRCYDAINCSNSGMTGICAAVCKPTYVRRNVQVTATLSGRTCEPDYFDALCDDDWDCQQSNPGTICQNGDCVENPNIYTPYLWAGIGPAGLRKVNLATEAFLGEYSISNVSGIAVSSDGGTVWIANGGSGLRVMPANNDFSSGGQSVVTSLSFSKVTIDADGNVWAINSNSVSKINSLTKELIGTYTVSGGAADVIVDMNRFVWVVGQGKVTKLSVDTGSVLATYNYTGGGSEKIAIDASGNLWIAKYGSGTDGVLKLNPLTGTFTTYTLGSTSTTNLIYDIAVDKKGNVWVGQYEYTVGGRLYKLAPTSSNFSVFMTNTSMDTPYLSVDAEGNLWVSSVPSNVYVYPVGYQKGLLKIDGDTGSYNFADVIPMLYVMTTETGFSLQYFTKGKR
jgi:streptogramin lyase